MFASTATDPRFNPCVPIGSLSRSSQAGDFKIGITVATLPGAPLYRVSAGMGWPGVSIL